MQPRGSGHCLSTREQRWSPRSPTPCQSKPLPTSPSCFLRFCCRRSRVRATELNQRRPMRPVETTATFERRRTTRQRRTRSSPASCKRRGFCPSWGGRRMTDREAHLVDPVLRWAPVRRWVLVSTFRRDRANVATMVTDETEITIDAPPSVVWEHLIDFVRHAEWTEEAHHGKPLLRLGAARRRDGDALCSWGDVFGNPRPAGLGAPRGAARAVIHGLQRGHQAAG